MISEDVLATLSRIHPGNIHEDKQNKPYEQEAQRRDRARA